MKMALTLLVCLIVTSFSTMHLMAETLGTVEYHLPKDGQGWKTLPTPPHVQGEGANASTITIWIPSDSNPPQVSEAFVVHKITAPTDLKDQNSLKDGIERGMRTKFANPKATVTILEQTPDSILYEFSVSDSGQEKEHGWIRAFTGKEGTTMLTYQTELVDKVGEKRGPWLETLKNAKVKNQ